ncbi:hypothetical protein L596_029927 [Steinernema carpocapsae]|uniref:UDP-xylose and UDP-N-acetylglucosamine transporter n=1 Tax=Steinernema carpocapsae TaxID=34508 RepID=A0A4U5LR73_STECR|nr:hypothetical protein L596_029927 [Steinernema carpocapsae]
MTTALVPISGALSGCIGCMIFVESLAKAQPGAMNLMTFATFFFIALEGLISTSKFFTVKPKIPFKGYLPVVAMFFFVNVVNNQALNFHIPVPLHIIFRSGSLLASLLLTKLIQNKQYSLRKYLSVFAITIGIIVCTLATSSLEKGKSSFSVEEAEKHYKEWIIGVVMLTVALLASAYLAICQERMYRNYGKHPREAMFYVHLLSLPFFAFMWGDIKNSMDIFSASSELKLLGTSTGVPYLWAELITCCVLQWVCIRFVYRLNAEVESLTVTLVVTLRKFLSLLISIVWFQNPFTFTHWIGAFFVFAGTLAFADIWGTTQPKKKVQ